jgi:DNA recombination-dependent growth factor C
LPKRYAQTFLQNIKLRTFQPLDPDEPDQERSGWCAPGNPLDLGLSNEQVFNTGYLVLGLRVDRWRVPRALLKAQLDEAVAALKAKSGRDKISKKSRDELKLRIERKLRRRVVPSVRCTDLCWNLEHGHVLFWSRSQRSKEDFRALFEQTFQLVLDEDSPYLLAQSSLPPARSELLQEVTPSELAPDQDAGA